MHTVEAVQFARALKKKIYRDGRCNEYNFSSVIFRLHVLNEFRITVELLNDATVFDNRGTDWGQQNYLKRYSMSMASKVDDSTLSVSG